MRIPFQALPDPDMEEETRPHGIDQAPTDAAADLLHVRMNQFWCWRKPIANARNGTDLPARAVERCGGDHHRVAAGTAVLTAQRKPQPELGVWVKTPGDDLLSHAECTLPSRVRVSLPSSEWDRWFHAALSTT